MINPQMTNHADWNMFFSVLILVLVAGLVEVIICLIASRPNRPDGPQSEGMRMDDAMSGWTADYTNRRKVGGR